jgi:hypothetical protein
MTDINGYAMLQQINESIKIMDKPNTVVFCFGRFQPVTKGHEKLINRVVAETKKHKADHMVFLSQTHRLPDNPLNWDYKRSFARLSFPGIHISEDVSIKTPYQALEKLAETYKKIIFVCGSDRVEQFSSMAGYAKEWGVTSFVAESAGTRNSNINTVEGVSGSIAREAVNNNDFRSFFNCMPSRITQKQAVDLFRKLQTELGLEESPEELNKEAEVYRKGSLAGIFHYTGAG